MLKNLIVRITGLATAVFVALLMSAEGALAVVLPDPGVVDGNVSTAAPSPGFEFLGQPWLVPALIVIVGIAIIAVVVIAPRRHRPVATACPASQHGSCRAEPAERHSPTFEDQNGYAAISASGPVSPMAGLQSWAKEPP